MLERGLPTIIVRLLSYWYSSQRFLISWSTSLSAPFKVSNGVRQGGIMSPLLYNVFIDDLSKMLSESKIGCYVNNACVNHLMYADDSVLVSPSPFALQSLVNMCEQYANDNEITYNAKKTVCMCIKSKPCKNINVPSISLDGKLLKWVLIHKYLGVVLRNDMNDCDDMKRQLCAIYAKGNMMLRKFNRCSDKVKVTLFKAHCMNLYCCPLWICFNNRMYQKVKVAYNNIFRHMFGIRRREHVSCHYVSANILPFNVIIRKSIFNLKSRIENNSNLILSSIVNSKFFMLSSSMNCRWKKSLYMY